MQEYEWPDGRVEVGGADFDMWNTIGEGLNFNFRQELTFNQTCFQLFQEMIFQPHTECWRAVGRARWSGDKLLVFRVAFSWFDTVVVFKSNFVPLCLVWFWAEWKWKELRTELKKIFKVWDGGDASTGGGWHPIGGVDHTGSKGAGLRLRIWRCIWWQMATLLLELVRN